MRIAVCLSGQPRSIEFARKSILRYFNAEGVQVDFFCHAWDYNTWKLPDHSIGEYQQLDKDWLTEQLLQFNPISYVIETQEDLFKAQEPMGYVPFGSLYWSMMIANHLKRAHEIEMGFRYDVVFKCRYDNVFDPDTSVMDQLRDNWIGDRTIYFPHNYRMGLEYNQFNASDCIFFGDSWGMDLVCDIFRKIREGEAPKRRIDNYHVLGPGTRLTKYGQAINLDMKVASNFPEIMYRAEVLGMDSVDDFYAIKDMHHSYYR
jgi:hypothetical protein